MDSSNQLVIVALPSENDPVRKFSSQKEPHLTLLYLGDYKYTDEQLTRISRFVEYATTFLCTFSLDVVNRGTLGPENADVLFFNKNWSRQIAAFRDQLLQEPLISAAYNSADQFPEWMPHLTMGFPDDPAKKDDRDRDYPGFTYVNFDRIALWTSDSSGPTFPMKTYDMDVAMAVSHVERGRSITNQLLHKETVDLVDDFNLEDEYGGLLDLLDTHISKVDPNLEHHGVKGMKWGVRKADSGAPGESLKSLGPDSVSRKTKNGETITLQKVTPSKFQKFLGRRSKKFRDEYSQQAMLNILDSSGKKVGDAMVQKKNKDELYLEWLGINKSERGKGYASAVMQAGRDFGKQEGFKKMTLEVPANSPDARHIYEKLGFKYVGEVDGGFKDPVFGGLSKMEYDFDTVKHNELAHHGVKGMKWGVRRTDAQLASGRGSGASADAKMAEAAKAKINVNGTQSLSNQQLQGLITRMNLERQYSQMVVQNTSEIDRGLQTTQKILKVGKTVEDVRRFLETPTGKAVKTGLKAVFTTGAAFATGGTSGAAAAGTGLAVRTAANHFTNVGR